MYRHQVRVLSTVCAVSVTTAGYLTGLVTLGTHLSPLVVNALSREGGEPLPVPYPVGGLAVAVVVTAVVAAGLWAGRGLSHRLLRWREPTAAEASRLDPAVDRLSMQFDVETPRVRVFENTTPTAYTVARPGEPATVVVTTGLLERLSEAELTAVVAHELAHVANRDAAVLTAVSTGPLVCGLVYHAADRLWRKASRSGNVADFLIEGFVAGVVAGITLVCWVPLAVVVRQLSRSREFVADRAAARATGDPEALVSALERVDAVADERSALDDRLAEPALDQLSFVETHDDTSQTDAAGADDPTTTPSTWTTRLEQTVLGRVTSHPAVERLFATHPETDARVTRLRRWSRPFAGR